METGSESEKELTLDEALKKVSDFAKATKGEGVWSSNADVIFGFMRDNVKIGKAMCQILSDEKLTAQGITPLLINIAKQISWAVGISEETKRSDLLKAMNNVRVNKTLEE